VNRHVNAIAGRLSLRPPQRRSLEILDRITTLVPLGKRMDVAEALAVVHDEFPSVTDFEREFLSVCFALATGVGKTRLMGAFISYLHLAHGMNNFFVLAPNLTIYQKLIADFTPNTQKYVFKGIAEFAASSPDVITGDDYEARAGSLFDSIGCKINIFNISKINSEVRGGRSPRIKRLSEYIGESYFEYLAGLPDLVLLMDESHRYRASAGVRAINELKPTLGLELTATAFVETPRGAVPFKNVIYDYPLGRAMADGFVKEPAVVTRKDFAPVGMGTEEIERLKLEDGVRLHESIKVELETYGRENAVPIVKPFLLVIARETTHAKQLVDLIKSAGFFEGRYKDKVIQVDSSKTGAEEEEMIARLLKVEQTAEPTEIVIHVNMLKEGWDVTNLYTIVPLRPANARTLIEQSIGRGLRLPYGTRTGVAAVDRLNIVAHDRFQEIVDEASRPESAIRLQTLVLNPAELERGVMTVVSQPQVTASLGITSAYTTPATVLPGAADVPLFVTTEDQKVARIAYEVIKQLENQPGTVPTATHLAKPEVQAGIVRTVEELYKPRQTELQGITEQSDVATIVAKTTELVIRQTISIPRILVVPRGELRSGFRPFELDLSALRYQPVQDTLWIQHLRTSQREELTIGHGGMEEARLEDYVVRGLVDFDDISYESNADLLYDLAAQVVRHLRSYLSEDDARKVVRYHHREIARFIHAQMQPHYYEDAAGYDVVVTKGVTELRDSAYTAAVKEPVVQYQVSPADKSNMSKYLFGGFRRCLYPVQKFQSEPERKLAVILDRESLKWFRPAKGQFQIFYRIGANYSEYQPDFVAETDEAILMLEPKRRSELESADVQAKKAAADEWCRYASTHAVQHGGKPWEYVLIPHDVVAENMTLSVLRREFGSTRKSNRRE
jgi:type III restriction enzyme